MNPETEGRQAAIDFRARHGLGQQALGDLVAVIETTMKIDVAVLDVAADEHGLTMFDPQNQAIFIGVASTTNPMRQRSTLAHELAHAIFQDWRGFEAEVLAQNDPLEQRANSFARHLLLPEGGLRDFVGERKLDGVSKADLSAVVQHFLVSPGLAAIALSNINIIDAATKAEWLDGSRTSTPKLATQFGWSDHYRALQSDSSRTRAPQHLLARAIHGYQEGVVTTQTIATIRGVDVRDVEADLEEALIWPRSNEAILLDAADLPEVTVDLSGLDGPKAAGGRGFHIEREIE